MIYLELKQRVGILHFTEDKEHPTYPQGSEEPLVLSADIALLKQLLDLLFRIFPLRGFAESLTRNGSFERLEFESITSGEQVRVVHGLIYKRKDTSISVQKAKE